MLTLYLLYLEDGQYKPVKVWNNLTRTEGVLVEEVDESWFPSPLPENQPNRSWTAYAYMLGSGVDLQAELAKIPTKETFYPAPTNFTLIQNVTSSTATTTATNTTTETNHSTDVTNGIPIPWWMILVICIACIATLVIVVSAAWLVINRRRSKEKQIDNPSGGTDEKADIQHGSSDHAFPAPAFMRSSYTSSLHSSLPKSVGRMQGIGSSVGSFPVIQSPSTSRSLQDLDPDRSLFAIPEARTSSSILSSTDALMIADTFRHLMRKPEWTERYDEGDDDDGKDDGTQAAKYKRKEEEFSHGSEAEKRRQLGAALLQKQLAEEGTDVRSVEKISVQQRHRTSQEDSGAPSDH